VFPLSAHVPRHQKQNNPFLFLRLLIAAFGLGLLINPHLRYWTLCVLEYPFRADEYRHFGIRLPESFAVHGIDVSRYQQRIDWARVANVRTGQKRIHFAFIKATEGSWMKDPFFAYNWENARRHGIIRGAYHYFLPDISPGDQVRHFVRTVRLRSGDLPPVVDVEEHRGMTVLQVRKYLKMFLDALHRHYGVRPIVYTNRDFYKNYFAHQADFKPYVFWIAHYYVEELRLPDGAAWHFWQHSDRGRIAGIAGRVDFNVFKGDSTALRELCLP